MKPPKVREAIREHVEQLRLNKDLVTIKTDLPFSLNLDAFRCQGPDEAALRALLKELEFHSLLKRLKFQESDQPQLL